MSDVPPPLQAALASRYTVHRVLGRGGMATVYLARDLKHHRDVALKVLRPDLAASLGADRFLQEIEIAARLVHPHILALHDSGELEGYLYYVMPYIEGGSLREELARTGRLGLARTLAVAGPVADALGYAHRMAVVHRDIKPENILFAQGHPVVADFGIAKAVSTAGGAALTRTGFPLGTPGYMSPEQAVGLTDLDERTDVYSLAVLVYEMLVGETPGHWPSEESVRQGRLREAPAKHRATLELLPPHVEAALARALTARSDDRTGSVGALIGALRGETAASSLAPPSLAASSLASPPPAPPRRRFSDDEVQEMLRRATELEAGNPTMSGALTIGAIEQVAAEAGISVERVREAARGMEPAVRSGDAPVPVGPSGELPDPRPVNQLGRSFSWNTIRPSGGTGRDIQVLVAVRNGRTRIQVRENLSPIIGGIWGGVGGGMGGGGLGPIIGGIVDGLHAPLALLFAIPAWLTVAYATARTSYYYTVRRRRTKLIELIDRLDRLAEDLIGDARPKRLR